MSEYGTFTCDVCGSIDEKTISPEEEKAQFHKEFPHCKWRDDMAIVCQDCFDKMNSEVPTENWAEFDLR